MDLFFVRPPSLLLLLVLAFSLGACARRETPAEAGARTSTLHLSIGPDPSGLDPQLATSLGEVRVLSALFEGLVDENPATGAPAPAAAERWEISADGSTYVFHLRPDGRWSDGTPVTAEDFVCGARRALSPKLGAPNAALLFPVLNAEAWHRGKLARFEDVGIRAVDTLTLRVELERPTPHFLRLLSHPVWFPAPRHVIATGGAEDDRGNRWASSPTSLAGNGAFVLREWRRGRALRVEATPGREGPRAARLKEAWFHVFDGPEAEERAFRAGQLHLTDSLPTGRVATWRTEAPDRLRTDPFLDVYFYRINTTRPFLRDVRVRQALSLAIDRETLVSALFSGGQRAATAFVPPGTGGYTPPVVLRHDPEAARALLAEAGYPGGAGLPDLDLLYNTSDNHRRVAEVLQRQWAAIGVRARLVNQEFSSLLEARRSGDFQLVRSGWVADYEDPSSFLDLFTADSAQNFTGWADPDYDHLLRQAARTADPAARHQLWREAETRLLTATPLLPLFTNTHVYLLHPAVRAWHPHPLDRHPLASVWLDPAKP